MKSSAILVTAKLCLRVSVNPIEAIKKYLTKSSVSPVRANLCQRDSYRQIKTINKQAVKKLLGLLGGALLLSNVHAQKINIEPFFIGDRIPDLPLHRIINYKDSFTTLSSFGDKLIILDFWSIHCRACIEKFPFIDSVQHANKDRLQFILVTSDHADKVNALLQRFDSTNNIHFSLPIVCGDSVLIYLFRHYAVPHYALIAPDGNLLAQSHADFINAPTIEFITHNVLQTQTEMRKDNFPASMYSFPKLPQKLVAAFNSNSIKEKE